ncbi:MAG TPA: hypothetical protein DCL44_00500 [Elusimicrobia bacterium]|nr:hypothetical protein [Elusimicrobiota bacterium]
MPAAAKVYIALFSISSDPILTLIWNYTKKAVQFISEGGFRKDLQKYSPLAIIQKAMKCRIRGIS